VIQVPAGYTRTARALHWLTVCLLVVLFGLGISMTRWIEGDTKLRVYAWHEWVGATVFALTAVRLWWLSRHPAPALALPRMERAAVRAVHWSLYAVLIAQPITGWLMNSAFGFPLVYLGLVPVPDLVPVDRPLALRLQAIHFTLAMVLVALVAVHLGGVLFRHIVHRDGVLRRMWFTG
jgi:cytochrome b561